LTILGAGAYVWWFLAQPNWGLKTKYVLFLLPAFAVYVVCGLGWINRRAPALAAGIAVLLIALIVLVHAYLTVFSIG
jgi:hypothetical protein